MLQVYPNEDDLRVKAASYFASAIDGPEAFKRLMLYKGMKEMQDRKLPFVRPSSIDEKTWNSMAPRFTKEQDRSKLIVFLQPSAEWLCASCGLLGEAACRKEME
eukprot:GHVT01058927.1.p2 GENE.GHVT01058927.1~~GHVT01058927.1.p2  ORF type:complete len:104 (-),score=11.29 GHVT01058927.1:1187-1498(-)